MDDARYRRALLKALRVEVQGEAFYAAAARTSRDPVRRGKWEILRRLETETKRRIVEALPQEVTPPPARLSRWTGYGVGALVGVIRWPVTMRVLRAITRHTIGVWERLERVVDGRHAELHAYLVIHEQVQHEFTVRELAGDGATSLDPVRALLPDGKR